jgi:hypothetical protein
MQQITGLLFAFLQDGSLALCVSPIECWRVSVVQANLGISLSRAES